MKTAANGKGAFENEKLADESVQARQTERREHGDAHPSAEQGSALHQAAEIVEAAQPAPLFEQSDEVEQGGGGNAVIEDLHEDAAQRGMHVDRRGRRSCADGEETEHAVAQMVDRQVGDHSFQIALRPRGQRRKNNRTHRQSRAAMDRGF